MTKRFKILFITYGGGHVRMALPVAQALAQKKSHFDVVYLGLTTAAAVVKQSNIKLLQFSDLVLPAVDDYALAVGRQLSKSVNNSLIPLEESIAYLGLSFAELVDEYGEAAAQDRYNALGRHAFLPVKILERALKLEVPDLVVITNSPRAERAGAIAAKNLGYTVLCLIDLFAVDEVKWIGRNNYAQAFCVLNESVKQFLINNGCNKDSIYVTGNPAFDKLGDPDLPLKGRILRNRQSCGGRFVILWPMVDEPINNPFTGEHGDSSTPLRALSEIERFVLNRRDVILWVRPRPGCVFQFSTIDDRLVVAEQSWDLGATLFAVDLVVAMSTTVAVEAYLVGTPVLKVLGSVFDKSMPLVEHGIAFKQVEIDQIQTVLNDVAFKVSRKKRSHNNSVSNVISVIERLLTENASEQHAQH